MLKKVTLAIVGVVLFLGAFRLYNEFKSKHFSYYESEQDRIAQYIVNHVELTDGSAIEKIEFIDFQKNYMTGTWRIATTINSKYDVSWAEDNLGGDVWAFGYYSEEMSINGESENESATIENITIVYYKEN